MSDKINAVRARAKKLIERLEESPFRLEYIEVASVIHEMQGIIEDQNSTLE